MHWMLACLVGLALNLISPTSHTKTSSTEARRQEGRIMMMGTLTSSGVCPSINTTAPRRKCCLPTLHTSHPIQPAEWTGSSNPTATRVQIVVHTPCTVPQLAMACHQIPAVQAVTHLHTIAFLAMRGYLTITFRAVHSWWIKLRLPARQRVPASELETIKFNNNTAASLHLICLGADQEHNRQPVTKGHPPVIDNR